MGRKCSGHWTNMQNTLGYKNILGLWSLEEHLASWTRGCEGQKGSGEAPLALD